MCAFMHAALLCACLAAGRAAARAAGGAQAEMFPQTCATGNCNKAMGSSSLLQRRAVDSMAEYYESDLEGEEGEEYDEVVVTKATSEGSANKATNKEHQVSAGSNGKKKAASNEKKSRNSRTKGSIATNTSKDDASSRRNWQRVAASHSSLVSVDGHHVWLITRDQKIWYRAGISSAHWQQVPGRLRQVDANGDGSFVWGLNNAGFIYFSTGVQGAWKRIPGRLQQISVAPNGHVWAVNSAGLIYFRNGEHGRWENIPGRMSCVAVNGDQGDHVWGLNKHGHIYKRIGQAWKNIPGRLAAIDVNKDGVVWGTQSSGRIYRRTGVDGHWEKVSGTLKQVSVGSTVWGVNAGGSVYYGNAP